MLRARLITAIILLPLVLLAIFYLPMAYFSLVLSLVIALSAWEWSGMIGYHYITLRWCYVVAVLLGIYLVGQTPLLLPLTVGALTWVWALAGIISYQRGCAIASGFLYPAIRSLVGFIILVCCWVAVMTLNYDSMFGPAWLVFVLCVIWGADVGAYFAGRQFGKRPLMSRVSPKKTWAGFLGGMLTSGVIALVGGLCFQLDWEQYVLLFVLAMVTAVFSAIGDLGVSLVKRIAGVKDSGNIIPGHGGILDRLDSIASATVVFVLLALLMKL